MPWTSGEPCWPATTAAGAQPASPRPLAAAVRGLVSVNRYLIQDIARASQPIASSVESGLWYQYYFQTERGRAGLTANRREIARTLWIRNSPNWRFDEATLGRHAAAFDNPDMSRW